MKAKKNSMKDDNTKLSNEIEELKMTTFIAECSMLKDIQHLY